MVARILTHLWYLFLTISYTIVVHFTERQELAAKNWANGAVWNLTWAKIDLSHTHVLFFSIFFSFFFYLAIFEFMGIEQSNSVFGKAFKLINPQFKYINKVYQLCVLPKPRLVAKQKCWLLTRYLLLWMLFLLLLPYTRIPAPGYTTTIWNA